MANILDDVKTVTSAVGDISKNGVPIRIIIDPMSIFLIAVFVGFMLILATAGSAKVEQLIKNT